MSVPHVTEKPESAARGSSPATGSACPHCGGKTGYYYKMTIYGEQWMEWNGDPVNFQDTSSKHGIKRCQDCKKRITPNDEASNGRR